MCIYINVFVYIPKYGYLVNLHYIINFHFLGHGYDLSDAVNNVFAGGLPGYGKTLSVEALLRQMEAEQR
jgi:hypothetical protein